jgi:transposase InsO family protein
VLELGWPPAEAARAQGVSVATCSKWLGRDRTKGRPGWSTGAVGPHQSAAAVGCSGAGDPGLAANASGGAAPDRVGVGRVALDGLGGAGPPSGPRLAELDRPSGQVVRYQRQRPGELVHVDIKAQGRIPDGGGHRLLGRGRGGANCDRRHGLGDAWLQVAIDDRTRLAYVEALGDQRGETAAGFLTRALAWFASLGVQVEPVLTDNGWCYRSPAFQQVLAQAGAGHRRTRPDRPQTNGKAERFNRTLAAEWSYAQLYASNQARSKRCPAGCTTTTATGPHRPGPKQPHVPPQQRP